MEDQGIYIYEKEAYISRESNWMLKWGIVLVISFFVLVVVFASFFSFNESIKASVVLTTLDPPVHLRAKQTGKLIEVNYNPGDTVSKGDILGVLENTGEAKDMVMLKQKLTSGYPLVLKPQTLSDQFPNQLRLSGQIRPFYNRFLNAYRNLIFYRSLDNEELKETELKQQLLGQSTAIKNKKEEIIVLQRDLEIAQIDFDRYQELLKKGVISLGDLEKREKGYLKVQREYGILEQELNQLRMVETGIRNTQKQFDNSRLKNENTHGSILELEQEELISALTEWEEQYLFTSPIAGRISFFDVWGKHQNVKENQVVFTVVPLKNQGLLGRCQVPILNSGKIRPGQRVIIKLENYPYREWGSLKGEVNTISEVPRTGENEGYVVYVKIKDLVTSYGRTLEFKQEMIGSAEIILEEVTLLQRIFYQFRNLWSNTQQ